MLTETPNMLFISSAFAACLIRLTTPLSLGETTGLITQLELQPSEVQTHLTHCKESTHYNPHPHSHPLTLDKLCPIHTSAFILIARLWLILPRPTPEVLHFLRTITASYKTCQMSDPNSRYHRFPFPTHQARGSLPGTGWQLDFTHMSTVR